MNSKKLRTYHLFGVFAILNLLIHYLSVGTSALEIHNNNKGFFDDELFNYFLCVSVLIIMIWLSYWRFRNRLISEKLIRLHLFITFVTVFILPWIFLKLFNPMPRRYYDYNNGFKILNFGNMTWSFIIVCLILLLSQLLLIKNIRRQSQLF